MTDKQIIIEDYFNILRDKYGRIYCIQDVGDPKSLIKAIREQNEYIQAKEQECEKLKEAIDGLLKIQYQLADSCTKYEQTLTEIKEMLKEICMEECSFDWNKTSKKHCGDCDCRYGQILQKISECEGNNDMENN